MTPLAVLDAVDEVVASVAEAAGHDDELFELCGRYELPLELLSQLNWHLR